MFCLLPPLLLNDISFFSHTIASRGAKMLQKFTHKAWCEVIENKTSLIGSNYPKISGVGLWDSDIYFAFRKVCSDFPPVSELFSLAFLVEEFFLISSLLRSLHFIKKIPFLTLTKWPVSGTQAEYDNKTLREIFLIKMSIYPLFLSLRMPRQAFLISPSSVLRFTTWLIPILWFSNTISHCDLFLSLTVTSISRAKWSFFCITIFMSFLNSELILVCASLLQLTAILFYCFTIHFDFTINPNYFGAKPWSVIIV